MTTVDEYARHSAYSDPGAYAQRLRELPDDIPAITDAVRNTIIHYRSGLELPDERVAEIDNRWVDRMLAVDQRRHPKPLTEPRAETERVIGCCRDFSLMTVAAMREKGVPARCRVGFGAYFFEAFHADHVLAEIWDGGRWRFVDAQLGPDPATWPMDTQDMPVTVGPKPGEKPFFYTAAQAWAAYRRGEVDPATFGVDPNAPELCGVGFMAGQVVIELTHRMKDELLLWDLHGLAGDSDVSEPTKEFVDGIADLILRADTGDVAAERELRRRSETDERLRPGDTVRCASPRGVATLVNLHTREESSLDGQ